MAVTARLSNLSFMPVAFVVIDQDSLLELSESGLLLSPDSEDSDSLVAGGCADGLAAVPLLRLNPKH